MFKKILIANRGEIAVRILRTCRDLGIATVAIYEPPDLGALHFRLADETVLIRSEQGLMDQQAILQIAKDKGADAIHPGYGFLAEEPDFIRACQAAGISFIGPPVTVVETARRKIDALTQAWEGGFATVEHSPRSFDDSEWDELRKEADRLGYPLVVKSCSGGRGRGERLVREASGLSEAVRQSQAETQAVYGSCSVYLERAILPAQVVGVQILADRYGQIVHLGERQGSLQTGNQKVIEESPAPCLTPARREQLWQAALALARRFNLENACTVEFLIDADERFYFTEIKARLQVEHPLTEMVTRLDLVREQIRIAAGERLGFGQPDVRLEGWAIQCRINAHDPWRHFLPSPGQLRRVRLPGGPDVRVDTYIFPGSNVPAIYDPLIAKLITWGSDRPACLARMLQAIGELKLVGTATNLPLLLHLLHHPDFTAGIYSTNLKGDPYWRAPVPEAHIRDLAVAAAVLYLSRSQAFNPSTPERLSSGWHRSSRQID